MRDALLDSRQRWRDLVTMAADLAFETDEWGRFVFVIPDPALGWSAATLIGQPAELLLRMATRANGFNPFRVTRQFVAVAPGSNARTASAAYARSLGRPLLDAQGRIVGSPRYRHRRDRVRRTRAGSRRPFDAGRCWTTSCGGWARRCWRPG